MIAFERTANSGCPRSLSRSYVQILALRYFPLIFSQFGSDRLRARAIGAVFVWFSIETDGDTNRPEITISVRRCFDKIAQ